jgi:hypothetical protein
MTRTISLITATVGTALLFAVPALSGNYDRYRMFGPGEHAVAANDDQTVSGAVMSPDSGTQIEWPQLGIGLGIGILLVLGLGLAMRTHVRPFAH